MGKIVDGNVSFLTVCHGKPPCLEAIKTILSYFAGPCSRALSNYQGVWGNDEIKMSAPKKIGIQTFKMFHDMFQVGSSHPQVISNTHETMLQ